MSLSRPINWQGQCFIFISTIKCFMCWKKQKLFPIYFEVYQNHLLGPSQLCVEKTKLFPIYFEVYQNHYVFHCAHSKQLGAGTNKAWNKNRYARNASKNKFLFQKVLNTEDIFTKVSRIFTIISWIKMLQIFLEYT